MKRVISDSERRLMEEGKRKSEEEIRKAKEYHATRRLLKYLHGYGKEVGFAWILVAIEVVCEVLIAYFAQSAVNVIQDAADAPLDWNSLHLGRACWILRCKSERRLWQESPSRDVLQDSGLFVCEYR